MDTVNRCFRLTQSKKEKFAKFRDYCLSKSRLSVLELQQLAGKCISFMAAVPGAKLFTREMNFAISVGIRSTGSKVYMSDELREEIETWKFLDTWDGKLEWKKERHISVELHSDASLYKWGGVINFNEEKKMKCMIFGRTKRKNPRLWYWKRRPYLMFCAQ